jgi:hypothetical protein
MGGGLGGKATIIVTAAAVSLASDEASYITGHVLNVEGGFGAAGEIFEPEEAE